MFRLWKEKKVPIRIDSDGVAKVKAKDLMKKIIDKDLKVCDHVWTEYDRYWLNNKEIVSIIFICEKCNKSKTV